MTGGAGRVGTQLLLLAGALAGTGLLSAVLAEGEPGLLVPASLAVAWYAAGALAARARPDHRVARLITMVGVTHLGAFALGRAALHLPDPRLGWALQAVALLLFAAGFAALAMVFAVFPDGIAETRAERLLVRGAPLSVAVVSLLVVLAAPRLEPVLGAPREAVPTPQPLPLLPAPVAGLATALPLLVVVGVVLLALRTRRATGARRAQLLWPLGAGLVLALGLLASPAATRVVPERAWSMGFVVVAGTIPFALLAGLVRYRLLDVDLLVGRTLAHGAVLVLVLTGYVAALTAARGSPWVAAGLTLVAALTGVPLRRWLEGVVDRLLTGGRRLGLPAIRRLAQELAAGAPDDEVPARVVGTVAAALSVSWVRLRLGGQVAAAAGHGADREPTLVVPVAAGEVAVGSLECGPRHGGWSGADEELLRLLAQQAALALQGVALRRSLAVRVEELTASRARLVRAEETVRRKVERDLHDGIQQQLVVLLTQLELARSQLPPGSVLAGALDRARDQAASSLQDLRVLVRGIHPPVLADRGLVAAVEARLGTLPLGVALDVDPRLDGVRFAPEVEGAAYFVVVEALTNVVKHAGAGSARVALAPLPGGGLQVCVADDGRGCRPEEAAAGGGLAGLRDRVEALGGRLTVAAPGRGTVVTATLSDRTSVDA